MCVYIWSSKNKNYPPWKLLLYLSFKFLTGFLPEQGRAAAETTTAHGGGASLPGSTSQWL